VCVAVRGPGTDAVVAGGEELRLPVSWPGLAGVDLLGPETGDGPASWVEAGTEPCGEEAFEAARIEAGVPRAGRELTEGTIAAEVGLVDRTVSFTKGCFTGQELVARLDARGSNVARRLCGVVPLDAAADPPVGAEVWTPDGAHLAGTLSSTARSPGLGAVVALAVLHRRIAQPAPVVLRWRDADRARETAAEARPLPLRT
jgi:tRNA-modifying protein YgfZ